MYGFTTGPDRRMNRVPSSVSRATSAWVSGPRCTPLFTTKETTTFPLSRSALIPVTRPALIPATFTLTPERIPAASLNSALTV